MTTIVDQWIEEEYFTSLCIILDNLDFPYDVENEAHRVMDLHTYNGILDQDGVDEYIDSLVGVTRDS